MNNETRNLLLKIPASESLDRLQDSIEKQDVFVEKLIKNQMLLLDALYQILNASTSTCKCSDLYKCIFCNGHEVFIKVLED